MKLRLNSLWLTFPAKSSALMVNLFSPSLRVVVNWKSPLSSTATNLSFIVTFVSLSSTDPFISTCLCLDPKKLVPPEGELIVRSGSSLSNVIVKFLVFWLSLPAKSLALATSVFSPFWRSRFLLNSPFVLVTTSSSFPLKTSFITAPSSLLPIIFKISWLVIRE